MTRLAAVVVARDEADLLPGCLARLGFVDEVVVLVDDRSTDATEDIARRHGATVALRPFVDFAQMKNEALGMTTAEWVLVVDADERVTSSLASQITHARDMDEAEGYAIPIRNYFFGQRMEHGGWTSEQPIRLFRRGVARYEGALHESLQFTSDVRILALTEPLVHFSHRSVLDSLEKTRRYAALQAEGLHRSGAPVVTSRRLLWVAFRELLRRLVRHRGYRDGVPGVAESLYQAFSLTAVTIHLWELQQQVPLDEQYRRLDEQLP